MEGKFYCPDVTVVTEGFSSFLGTLTAGTQLTEVSHVTLFETT